MTNAAFAEFVEATGYTTLAERPLDPAQYPGARPEMLAPGSLVFRMSEGPVDTSDHRNWWAWTPAPAGAARRGLAAESTAARITP